MWKGLSKFIDFFLHLHPDRPKIKVLCRGWMNHFHYDKPTITLLSQALSIKWPAPTEQTDLTQCVLASMTLTKVLWNIFSFHFSEDSEKNSHWKMWKGTNLYPDSRAKNNPIHWTYRSGLPPRGPSTIYNFNQHVPDSIRRKNNQIPTPFEGPAVATVLCTSSHFQMFYPFIPHCSRPFVFLLPRPPPLPRSSFYLWATPVITSHWVIFSQHIPALLPLASVSPGEINVPSRWHQPCVSHWSNQGWGLNCPGPSMLCNLADKLHDSSWVTREDLFFLFFFLLFVYLREISYRSPMLTGAGGIPLKCCVIVRDYL